MPTNQNSLSIQHLYDTSYYLNDCGGYEVFNNHRCERLDLRIEFVTRLMKSVLILQGWNENEVRGRVWRILDLGAGRGEISYHFAKIGFFVDAIDYSKYAIELLRETISNSKFEGLDQRINLMCGSVTDTSLWGNSYDVIVAADIIEHLSPREVEQLFEIASERLSESGALIVHTFPNLWYYKYFLPQQFRKSGGKGIPPEPRSYYEKKMHINEQSPKDLKSKLCVHFQNIIMWPAGETNTEKGLKGGITKNAWKSGKSLFAIASPKSLSASDVLASLTKIETLSYDDFEYIGKHFILNNDRYDFRALNAAFQEEFDAISRILNETQMHHLYSNIEVGCVDNDQKDDGLPAFPESNGCTACTADRDSPLKAMLEQLMERVHRLEVRLDLMKDGRNHETPYFYEGFDSLDDSTTKLSDWTSEFEKRFRGKQDDIASRLSIYLPHLRQYYGGSQNGVRFIDIGCGSGVWLDVLKEDGIECIGVDTDMKCIADLRARGLRAYNMDACAFLGGCAEQSVGAITAFHFIEHVSFPYLLHFLFQCFRVLKNEGVLILETPNPENILVGSCQFYTDPTHKRPVVPGLLEFIVTRAGFKNIELLRINPFPDTLHFQENSDLARRLNGFFFGPQDFAVIARK